MRLILLLLAISSSSFADLTEFSQIPSLLEAIHTPPNSQVFVISDGNHDDVLKTIQITETATNRSASAYDLSIPDSNGRLTPFVTTNYTYIIYSLQDEIDYNIPGYIYAANADDSYAVHVYVQRNEQILQIKSAGTIAFFPMNGQIPRIPVVSNLKVSKLSPTLAFVGIPEDNRPVFDSSIFESTYSYDRLEFPVKYFYFSSPKDRISFTVSTTNKINNYSTDLLLGNGLLLTQNYSDYQGQESASTFSFSNNNNAITVVHIYSYFHNISNPTYDTAFAFSSSGPQSSSDSHVSCGSNSGVCDIQLRTPLKKLVINSGGQYALQYSIQNLAQSSQDLVDDTNLEAAAQNE